MNHAGEHLVLPILLNQPIERVLGLVVPHRTPGPIRLWEGERQDDRFARRGYRRRQDKEVANPSATVGKPEEEVSRQAFHQPDPPPGTGGRKGLGNGCGSRYRFGQFGELIQARSILPGHIDKQPRQYRHKGGRFPQKREENPKPGGRDSRAKGLTKTRPWPQQRRQGPGEQRLFPKDFSLTRFQSHDPTTEPNRIQKNIGISFPKNGFLFFASLMIASGLDVLLPTPG